MEKRVISTQIQEEDLKIEKSLRPQTLSEYIGQEKAKENLKVYIEAAKNRGESLDHVLFYGPPGLGKTTLAGIIANEMGVHMKVTSGPAIAKPGEMAAILSNLQEGDLLFVDEIHRFSRSQQDSLLHAVENRTVVLVGATTENPFFEVNSALISRSRVIELHSLSDADIECIVRRALSDEKRGLAGSCSLTDEALAAIVNLSGGDGRSALTTLELAAGLAKEKGAREKTEPPFVIDDDMVELATPHRALPYDKNKDMHYDVISAFIKSMRGSDPDAALYWLARMLDGGEDPKFIARRIFILASEDIGNADPQALLIAEAAFKAVEVIGMPECRINLSQAVTYMCLAPKSNAAEASIDAALSEVRHGPKRDVPSYLRDRHRPGSENYGEYKYPHDYPGHWVEQRYLPEGLERGCFYQPSESGWEAYRVDAASRDRATRAAKPSKGE